MKRQKYTRSHKWCPGTESNRGHGDFQSPALPTELPGHHKLDLGTTLSSPHKSST